MKQFDENTDSNDKLRSFNSVSMDESDKKEVYSKLMNSIEKKKSKKRVLNWSNQILSAAFVVVFLIGGGYFVVNQILDHQAAPQDKYKEAIETVLEQTFSGPDKKLQEILDKKETYIKKDKFQEYQDELYKYYKAAYQPYFVDNRLQEYVMGNKLTFNELAYSNGHQMKVTNIDVKEDNDSEGAYDFTVHVQNTKGDNSLDEIMVSGRVNFSENGKINSLRYFENGGLADLIKSIQTD